MGGGNKTTSDQIWMRAEVGGVVVTLGPEDGKERREIKNGRAHRSLVSR